MNWAISQLNPGLVGLSKNNHEWAISQLKLHPEKIYWRALSSNNNIFVVHCATSKLKIET